MDSNPFYRYADSQDQLIISLNEQIQTLLPLKQSYASLQRYHIKITHDLNSLLTEHDQVSEACGYRIKELLAMNEELDSKKTKLMEELRRIENQKAKLILERKNMTCACETLGSKFNLENQQSVLHQDRTRQLLQTNKKAEQSVEYFRKVVLQLEKEITLKNTEKAELEDEILRKKSTIDRLSKNCQNIEHNIENVEDGNKSIMQRNKELDHEIIQTEMKIRQELKRGKFLNEESIKKKEELTNLYNKKEYYYRLIESQLIVKEDFQISEQKYNHLLQKRTQELTRIREDNEELRKKIMDEEDRQSKNRAYKGFAKNYLSQLIHANQCLLNEMEECCTQDQKVHKILLSKVGRLQISREKVKNGDLEPRGANILKQKSTNIETSQIMKTANNTGKTWISELKDLENYSIK